MEVGYWLRLLSVVSLNAFTGRGCPHVAVGERAKWDDLVGTGSKTLASLLDELETGVEHMDFAFIRRGQGCKGDNIINIMCLFIPLLVTLDTQNLDSG